MNCVGTSAASAIRHRAGGRRKPRRVVAVYNQRDMDQHGSKRAGTRCRTFAAIAVHLQLHVLAYNFRMFL
jgi:hypothetical protein